MIDAGLGFAFENGFRAEAELARRANEVTSSEMTAASFEYYSSSSSAENVFAISLMANGFYDFNRDGAVSPYIGVGVGWAKVSAGDDDDSKLAWQAMAGVGVALSEQHDARYRLSLFRDRRARLRLDRCWL